MSPNLTSHYTRAYVCPKCTLVWQDVDLNQRFLLVRRGKNGESRYARLNSVALKALNELKKRGDGTGPVIRSLTGEPLSGRVIGLRKRLRTLGSRVSIGMI